MPNATSPNRAVQWYRADIIDTPLKIRNVPPEALF